MIHPVQNQIFIRFNCIGVSVLGTYSFISAIIMLEPSVYAHTAYTKR